MAVTVGQKIAESQQENLLTRDDFLAYNNLTVTAQKNTAPESLVTTAGASTRPTEAGQAGTLIMAPVRAFRKERPDALPSLSEAL